MSLGGRRAPVSPPRVRTFAGHDDGEPEREVGLDFYATVGDSELLAEGIVACMLAGISTRRYPVALEPVCAEAEQRARWASKWAISQRLLTAAAELQSAPLDEQLWLGVSSYASALATAPSSARSASLRTGPGSA